MLASLAMLAPKGALRVAPGGSAPPILYVARRGFGHARSGRESRLAGRTGKQALRGRCVDRECRSGPTTIVTREPSVTEPLGVEIVCLVVDKMTPHGEHSGEAMPGSLGSIPE